MKVLTSFWNRFWFSLGSELNFKVVRWFLFSGGAIFGFFIIDSHPPTFYQRTWDPISFYHLLNGPISDDALRGLRWAWLAFSFVAGFGIYYRWTALLAFICGAIYLGHDYNFGVVYHSHHVYIMCIGIMTASEFLQHGIRKKGSSLDAAYYHWSLQWVKCYIVYVMLLCGIEKLWYGQGLKWAFSESFYMRLWVNPYHPPLTGWILEQPLFVSQICAIFALFVIELGAPLALFNKRMGALYFFIWSSFHVLVTLTYGNHITFYSQIFCYTALLDWNSFLPAKIKTFVLKRL